MASAAKSGDILVGKGARFAQKTKEDMARGKQKQLVCHRQVRNFRLSVYLNLDIANRQKICRQGQCLVNASAPTDPGGGVGSLSPTGSRPGSDKNTTLTQRRLCPHLAVTFP